MIRFIKHLIQIALILGLVLWLSDNPGTARIIWHDYVIETSAAKLVLGIALVSYFFYLLLRLWYFLRHGPEQWRLRRTLRKTEDGYGRLTKGFVALAAGDTAEAGVLAIRARKALGATPLTQLLQAQAAQLAGDKGTAREIFRTLAAAPESAALGYRGLIMEARRDENWHEVAVLAEKLQAHSPKSPLLNLVRFETEARRQEWAQALVELNKAVNAGLMDPARAKQNRAALFVASAQREAQRHAYDKALDFAEQAMRLSPDWPPAIINLAQAQWATGHQRAACRTVEKHWAKAPHPKLAEIYQSGESSLLESYKKLERLCRDNDDSDIAHNVLGESALHAQIWGEARRHFLALVNNDRATVSTYRLLASLERRERGDDLAASSWLTKATEATPDPVWLCQSCGGSHTTWQATCSHCGGFNSLNWQSPGRSRAHGMHSKIAIPSTRFDE